MGKLITWNPRKMVNKKIDIFEFEFQEIPRKTEEKLKEENLSLAGINFLYREKLFPSDDSNVH